MPLQQPPLQEVALQTQAPLAQAWPVAQALQLAPPVPQVPLLDVRHWPVESQQPFGHELALQAQAPLTHACPLAHAVHVAPPVPQVPVLDV